MNTREPMLLDTHDRDRPDAPKGVAAWMDTNLDVQGYRLDRDEISALRLGLRFPTALCLALVITGLALRSGWLLVALVPIGAVAGWTARHPFDHLWNHVVRRIVDSPELPSNPTPRRHAFKLATVWLLAVGVLFLGGYDAAALVLGAMMVAVCTLVTVTNFCIPSTMLGAWWRWRATDLG